jgi:hypothetical protein
LHLDRGRRFHIFLFKRFGSFQFLFHHFDTEELYILQPLGCVKPPKRIERGNMYVKINRN